MCTVCRPVEVTDECEACSLASYYEEDKEENTDDDNATEEC